MPLEQRDDPVAIPVAPQSVVGAVLQERSESHVRVLVAISALILVVTAES